jgi:ubiquinone/menaquinone biosynthesis C-methylase UbiE
MFKKIRKIIGHNAWVIDAGSGPGRSSIMLRKHVTEKLIAFDFDQEMLHELANNSLAAGARIKTVQGKVCDLLTHFPKRRFHAVTAFSAFTHFMDDASIQAIKRVLAPAGVFIDAGDEGVKNDKLGQIMRKVLELAGKTLQAPASQRALPNEREALVRNGFEPLHHHEFVQVEEYSADEALANFQSRLAYPKCTAEEEEKIKSVLVQFMQTELKSSTIRIPVTYQFTVYRPATASRL